MTSLTAGQSPGRFRKTFWILIALSLGATSCPGNGTPPSVDLTLNGVADSLKSLMIVPTSGFVINVSFAPGTDPIDPASFTLLHQRWGGGPQQELDVLVADASGAVGLLPWANALEEGTHTFAATVQDTKGRFAAAYLDFAVREIANPPPIDSNQFFWFDFSFDRDGDTYADFPEDLQLFGLGSAADPVSSAIVEAAVRAATMDRVREAYWSQPSSGLASDPIAVGVFDFDPGAPAFWDTTRICVGGEDPTGGQTIGNILIDPNNGNRTSVECSSLPLPTGVFPAEMLVYASQSTFQESFDPLMTSRGGTPVGEHALDPIVLDAGFDYGSATTAEQDRYDDIFTAVDRFGDALGTICAHEAGHALGLVPPAAPGVGLHGGQAGAEFSHSVEAGGGNPVENILMNSGGTFTFAELAGLNGESLPAFRAFNYAYLRDRTLTDSSITALLMPPAIDSVVPNVVAGSVQLTLSGSDFVGTPSIQLINPGFTYDTLGEAVVNETTVTFWVIQAQALPGLYDLVYTAGDGQQATLLDAVTIQ